MKPTKIGILLTADAVCWLDLFMNDLMSAKVHDGFTNCAESREVWLEVANAARHVRKAPAHTACADFDSLAALRKRKPINWCRLCGRVIRGPISPNVERSFCGCSIPQAKESA